MLAFIPFSDSLVLLIIPIKEPEVDEAELIADWTFCARDFGLLIGVAEFAGDASVVLL